MEESTNKSCSNKSCDFCFLRVLKAGFFAAILTNLLMIFQGNNALFYFGTLFLGTEADPKVIYLVGVLAASILGIVFALLYALIFGPWRSGNALVKAIIFAAILTAVSYYATPHLQQLANIIKGHSSSEAVVATTEAPQDVQSVAVDFFHGKAEKSLVVTFTNSLIFTLMAVVLYRRKHCRTTPKC